MTNRLEQLRAWLGDLQCEQEEVAAALEPLLRRREEVRQKLELVQRLLTLESEPQLKSQPGRDRDGVAPDASRLGAGGSRIGSDLQEAVKEILGDHGRPMHVSDIRAALVDKGIPIPGKGTDANIIVHLRRAPSVFERMNRGTYALTRSEPTATKESEK